MRINRTKTYSPKGAVKIPNQFFQLILLDKRDDGTVVLQMSDCELKKMPFPNTHELTMNVMRGRDNIETISMGTIGNPNLSPININMPSTKSIKCKLNIIEKGKHAFAAFSDWRHPKDSKNDGLFAYRRENLGDMIFNVEIPRLTTEKVTLVVNNTIDGIDDYFQENHSLVVLPYIVKQIFERILVENLDVEEEGTWPFLWWQWVRNNIQDADNYLEIEDRDRKEDAALEIANALARQSESKEFIKRKIGVEG